MNKRSAPVGLQLGSETQRPVLRDPAHFGPTQVGHIDLLDPSINTIRDESDLRIKRPFFAGQEEHDLVGKAVRHTAHVTFVSDISSAAKLFLLGHIEQARLDSQPFAGPAKSHL